MIISRHPNLRNKRIDTKELFEKQSFVPFTKIEENMTLWWTDYNKIKHNRTEKDSSDRYNYQKANLKKIHHAIVSLYILLLLIGKEFGFDNTSPISSKLFQNYIV